MSASVRAITRKSSLRRVSRNALTLPAWLQLTDHGDGTANLTGTPALTDLGAHAVELRVTDAQGAQTVLAFEISVVEAPTITLLR